MKGTYVFVFLCLYAGCGISAMHRGYDSPLCLTIEARIVSVTQLNVESGEGYRGKLSDGCVVTVYRSPTGNTERTVFDPFTRMRRSVYASYFTILKQHMAHPKKG